jgi:hypothetical protein
MAAALPLVTAERNAAKTQIQVAGPALVAEQSD